jgi:NAD(P)-dependent dehydrogenase (short-subunit alcohol dehydrogenase family)
MRPEFLEFRQTRGNCPTHAPVVLPNFGQTLIDRAGTLLNAHVSATTRDQFLASYQPLPGLIQPQEVATLAVYLASDAARMITGQVFVIDGGQQAGIF